MVSEESSPHLAGLGECIVPLGERYDLALLDLDGVVYIGQSAVPSAVPALEKVRESGLNLAFVTNNASRTPDVVAAHLLRLGIPVDVAEVVTSAQAASRLLGERLPLGATVLVVGAEGLEQAVRERGFQVVHHAADQPAAVVQGFSPDTGWRDLAEATVAIRAGALWVASNRDRTLPSPRGELPGNGSLVEVVRTATGCEPLVAGKPEPALFQEAVERAGSGRPLVVGDVLGTDIEGAHRIGSDSLLVLSGLTRPADLIHAPPDHRPTYLAADLEGLLVAHHAPQPAGRLGWECEGWRVDVQGDALVLAGTGEDVAALRTLCAASWRSAGQPTPGRGGGTPQAGWRVRAGGRDAAAALRRLDIE